MTPYILLFINVTFLYFSPNRRVPKLGFYVFLSLLILIAGFRDMIGGYDVYIYAQVYELGYEFITSYSPFEKGFSWYYIVLNIFNDSREFMFFITALFMFLLHFYTIKKYSPILYFSAFVFFCKFFLMSFVYLRQGLAMGLVWLSIPLLLNKKYVKFLVIVVIAFYFHRSAILFLPLLFIAQRKVNPYQLFLITTGTFIVSLSPLGPLILNYLIGGFGDDRIMHYTTTYSAANLFYLMEAGLLSYFALKFQKDFYQEKRTTLIFNGFVLYILIIIISLTNATFIRLSWVYFIFVVLALPYLYHFIKDAKLKRTFKILVFVYYSLVFFRLLLVFDGGDFLPYKSIFQDFNRNGIWEWMEYR